MAGAGSCACLGVLAAVAGGQWPAFLSAAILGAGIAAASLLLAWGVDVALRSLCSSQRYRRPAVSRCGRRLQALGRDGRISPCSR